MRLDSHLTDKVDSQHNMEGEIDTFMVGYIEWDFAKVYACTDRGSHSPCRHSSPHCKFNKIQNQMTIC